MNATSRTVVLRAALDAVGERGRDYGPPREHFSRTVGAANAVLAHKLREPLTPADWAVLMILDKVARHQHAPKLDNCVDIAGYAGCLGEVAQ